MHFEHTGSARYLCYEPLKILRYRKDIAGPELIAAGQRRASVGAAPGRRKTSTTRSMQALFSLVMSSGIKPISSAQARQPWVDTLPPDDQSR